MAGSFIGKDGVEYVVLKNNPFAGMSIEDFLQLRRDAAEDLGFDVDDDGNLTDIMFSGRAPKEDVSPSPFSSWLRRVVESCDEERGEGPSRSL